VFPAPLVGMFAYLEVAVAVQHVAVRSVAAITSHDERRCQKPRRELKFFASTLLWSMGVAPS
jgi:hypothetical protein